MSATVVKRLFGSRRSRFGDAGMTKKHFIAIADTLAAIRDPARRREETDRWIPTLKAQNPRFDEGRFRRYVDAQASKGVGTRAASYASRHRHASRRHTRGQCSRCGALSGGHFRTCGRRR